MKLIKMVIQHRKRPVKLSFINVQQLIEYDKTQNRKKKQNVDNKKNKDEK